jgi:FkbM family methyltransferase
MRFLTTNIIYIYNVKNKIVVNVGAYTGDSAIYFALRGAKKVIAIEPRSNAFNEMLENIRLNNLEDGIIPISGGVLRNHRRIYVKNNINVVEMWSTYRRVNECGDGGSLLLP